MELKEVTFNEKKERQKHTFTPLNFISFQIFLGLIMVLFHLEKPRLKSF